VVTICRRSVKLIVNICKMIFRRITTENIINQDASLAVEITKTPSNLTMGGVKDMVLMDYVVAVDEKYTLMNVL
ncbi:Hypothetical predicted protein, partial [Paramuricea clavata]